MQFFLTAWPTRPARASVIALGALAPLLLSGCGGSGTSLTNSSNTTFQGYRIVPAGGTVQPLGNSNLILLTQPGVVDTGVDVVATQPQVLPTSISPPANGTLVPGAVYQVTTSPSQPTLNNTIHLTLAFTPPTVASPADISTYKIFTYDKGQWVPLPENTVNITNKTVTVTADLNGTGNVPGTAFAYALPSFSSSGLYAVFASASPPTFATATISIPAGATISTAHANLGFPLSLSTGGLSDVTSVTLTGTGVNGNTATLTSPAITFASNSVTVTVPANEFSSAGPVNVTVTGTDSNSQTLTTSPAVLTVG